MTAKESFLKKHKKKLQVAENSPNSGKKGEPASIDTKKHQKIRQKAEGEKNKIRLNRISAKFQKYLETQE